MTIRVDITITTSEGTLNESIEVGDVAEKAVRFHFNPSALREVTILKALAAALYERADALRDQDPAKALEASHACYHTQTASMWAVAGATKGL